jgi:hypothetical protein
MWGASRCDVRTARRAVPAARKISANFCKGISFVFPDVFRRIKIKEFFSDGF